MRVKEVEVITRILADALDRSRVSCAELADRIKLAMLAEAGRRGARVGEIARKEILRGYRPKRKEE